MSERTLAPLGMINRLADVAAFIGAFKQEYPNVQFITFGCSYPGALAAWFRYVGSPNQHTHMLSLCSEGV